MSTPETVAQLSHSFSAVRTSAVQPYGHGDHGSEYNQFSDLDIGTGRCRRSATVWMTSGINRWGQPVLLKQYNYLASPSEDISVGSLGAKDGEQDPNTTVLEHSLESKQYWCTAWPCLSTTTIGHSVVNRDVTSELATIDLSVSVSRSGLQHKKSARSQFSIVEVYKYVAAKAVCISTESKDVAVTAPSSRAALLIALSGRAVTSGCWMTFSPQQYSTIASQNPESLSPASINDRIGQDEITFNVLTTDPAEVCVITPDTKVTIDTTSGATLSTSASLGMLDQDVPPGLEQPLKDLEELIQLPLLHSRVFQQLGLECPKGILLYGPPGTGKTLLARCVADRTGAAFLAINGPDVFAPYLGESEANLRAVFSKAEGMAAARPVLLFIDEIDALCPKREANATHENRVVAQLLTLMDGMMVRQVHLVVLAATNRPNALDPALRRPGRFDREVEIPAPTPEQRCKILEFCTRRMTIASDVEFATLAASTVGYVGADLAALAREAALCAVRRVDIDATDGTASGGDNAGALVWGSPSLLRASVTMEDFTVAMRGMVASTRRGDVVAVQHTSWEDIGGLGAVKEQLEQAAIWPLLYPQTFRRLGISPPRGVLLYGPPGCAKTTLARALASSCHASFFVLSGADIFSPYIGDAERAVRDVFRKARLSSPSIVFLDEVDAIVGNRDRAGSDSGGVQERVLATLLTEMDGIESAGQVLIVAATNRRDCLDKAFVRAGRIDRAILVPLPDEAARRSILGIKTRQMPLAEDVDLSSIASLTDGCSGADLDGMCREAAILAMRENILSACVCHRHFVTASRAVRRCSMSR
eukprot:m.331421 g.331421  ORF g.331421 m.331421 type:complete len:819 (-) comp20477_c0_seq2:465-2921(-)